MDCVRELLMHLSMLRIVSQALILLCKMDGLAGCCVLKRQLPIVLWALYLMCSHSLSAHSIKLVLFRIAFGFVCWTTECSDGFGS